MDFSFLNDFNVQFWLLVFAFVTIGVILGLFQAVREFPSRLGQTLRAFGRRIATGVRNFFSRRRLALIAFGQRLKARWRARWNYLRQLPRRLKDNVASSYRKAKRQWSETRDYLRTLQAKAWVVISFIIAAFFLVVLLAMLPPVALGVLAVLVAAGFLIPIWPGVAAFLSNKPNRFRYGDTARNYPKDTWGLFTFLQPGQVKIIERGNTFVRALMDWDGRVFEGELPTNDFKPDDWEYWNVVGSGEHSDSHPIPFPSPKETAMWLKWVLYSPLSLVHWLWKRWIYVFTGAVFTGIPGYQNVRTYPIDRFKLEVSPEGETNLVLIKDYSDHYRVAEYQFPIAVPRADTQDMIEVKWRLNQIARVVNPFMVAYNTDDNWTARKMAAITNAVTSVSRARPVSDLIGAKDLKTAKTLGDQVTKLTQVSVKSFGIEVVRTEIIDVTPTDATTARKLGDMAVAKVDRTAAEERAKGLAAPIREQGKALKEYPEAGLIPQNEAMVRTAAAAGDKAIVMLGGGKGMSAGNAAIIKELRELAQTRGNATT